MKLYNWTQVTEEPLTPTATRQMIHGATLTVAKLRTKKGSIVPTHSHINEQITTMEKGSMLFVTPTEQIVVRAGESLEDCVAIDIFSPVREDWVRGDDAYLRG